MSCGVGAGNQMHPLRWFFLWKVLYTVRLSETISRIKTSHDYIQRLCSVFFFFFASVFFTIPITMVSGHLLHTVH